MTAFLSSDFFEQAAERLRKHTGFADAARDVRLSVQFLVTDGPDGDISYGLVIDRGAIDVVEGELEQPDMTISNDYETAREISRGNVNTQVAFISGKLRVDGNMPALLRNVTLIEQFATAMRDMEVTF